MRVATEIDATRLHDQDPRTRTTATTTSGKSHAPSRASRAPIPSWLTTPTTTTPFDKVVFNFPHTYRHGGTSKLVKSFLASLSQSNLLVPGVGVLEMRLRSLNPKEDARYGFVFEAAARRGWQLESVINCEQELAEYHALGYDHCRTKRNVSALRDVECRPLCWTWRLLEKAHTHGFDETTKLPALSSMSYVETMLPLSLDHRPIATAFHLPICPAEKILANYAKGVAASEAKWVKAAIAAADASSGSGGAASCSATPSFKYTGGTSSAARRRRKNGGGDDFVDSDNESTGRCWCCLGSCHDDERTDNVSCSGVVRVKVKVEELDMVIKKVAACAVDDDLDNTFDTEGAERAEREARLAILRHIKICPVSKRETGWMLLKQHYLEFGPEHVAQVEECARNAAVAAAAAAAAVNGIEEVVKNSVLNKVHKI